MKLLSQCQECSTNSLVVRVDVWPEPIRIPFPAVGWPTPAVIIRAVEAHIEAEVRKRAAAERNALIRAGRHNRGWPKGVAA